MITCLPDWVSELSSNELRALAEKSRAQLADLNLLLEYEKNAEAELSEWAREMRKRRASALRQFRNFIPPNDQAKARQTAPPLNQNF